MTNSGAFHWTFHGPRSATSSNIQPPKTELITYLFGKIVFVTTNRVPTPTNNQVRFQIWSHNIRVTQDIENRLCNTAPAVEIIESVKRIVNIDHISQYRKQMFLNTSNHIAIDERRNRGVANIHNRSARLWLHVYFEIGIRLHKTRYIVYFVSAIQHGKCAETKQASHLFIRRHEALYLTIRK